MIVKYCAPSKHTKAAYGDVCEEFIDNDTSVHYIQINRDEEKPEWLRMGVFLERSLRDLFDDDTFIDACLRSFSQNQKSALDKIKKLV